MLGLKVLKEKATLLALLVSLAKVITGLVDLTSYLEL